MHCVSTFWGPSINRKPRTESLGPSEMPWKIALEHLADAYGVTQLLAKKGTPPGLIIMWGNLHYGASLVQEWEWEVEGVKAGSYGPARCSDICKLGSHCVSLFLSGSTLPPISPFSPLRPPPFPPGRGRSVSWTGPCPGLWPLCAGVGRGGGGGAPGVVCGSQDGNCFSQFGTLALCVGRSDFSRHSALQRTLGSPFCKSRVRVGRGGGF